MVSARFSVNYKYRCEFVNLNRIFTQIRTRL